MRTEHTYEAILAKGVGQDYDWTQMKTFMKEGRIPNFKGEEISNEILISEYFANRLQLKLGDNCHAIFLKDETSQVPNSAILKL